MNCKPPCLAFIKRGHLGLKHAGKVVQVLAESLPEHGNGPEWVVEFSHPIRLLDGTFSRRARQPDAWLEEIKGGEGNEQFVVESRRSLPRKKPVTGPVTIDNRGEVKHD